MCGVFSSFRVVSIRRGHILWLKAILLVLLDLFLCIRRHSGLFLGLFREAMTVETRRVLLCLSALRLSCKLWQDRFRVFLQFGLQLLLQEDVHCHHRRLLLRKEFLMFQGYGLRLFFLLCSCFYFNRKRFVVVVCAPKIKLY